MLPERKRVEGDPLLDDERPHLFALADCARRARAAPLYERSGRSGTVLVKRPELRLVLEVLRAGAELAEHHAAGRVLVQGLEGEVRFTAGGEEFTVQSGDLLSLPPGIPHRVRAVEDSAFLLTIGPRGRETEGRRD